MGSCTVPLRWHTLEAARGKREGCSSSSWREGLKYRELAGVPPQLRGITGPVEPYFLDTCLSKTLLESFTVMSCPEATKGVFNLKLNVIGAVDLVAVMIFGMIIQHVSLLCTKTENGSKSYKSRNCCTIKYFLFFFFLFYRCSSLHNSLHRRARRKGHQLNEYHCDNLRYGGDTTEWFPQQKSEQVSLLGQRLQHRPSFR